MYRIYDNLQELAAKVVLFLIGALKFRHSYQISIIVFSCCVIAHKIVIELSEINIFNLINEKMSFGIEMLENSHEGYKEFILCGSTTRNKFIISIKLS